MFNQIAKGSMLIFWAVFLFSFIRPFSDQVQAIVLYLGVILLLVHLVEFVVHRKRLDALNAGGPNGFIQTLLFGFVYWLPLFHKDQSN